MMKFKLAEEVDRAQIEALWTYCFEPKGHPFFEWYFANCYEPENILVGSREGQVLADVHLRPYTLVVRGGTFQTSYIVGLATHPAARRGGVGKDLLLASLQEMRKRNHVINILMPSKAAFYQPHGWELYCHQWKRTLPLEKLRPLTERQMHFGIVTSPEQWNLLNPVYEQYTESLSGYALRDEHKWKELISGQLVEGAVAVVFNEDKEAEGYLFYQLGAPTIMVNEFVYTSRRGQRALLNFLYNHRSQGESVTWYEGQQDQSYIFYPDGKQENETFPFMAVRIVDVQGALEKIPLAKLWEGDFYLQITDSLADWNDGYFHVTVSKNRLTVQRISEVPVEQDKLITTDVGALGLLLMGRLTARELFFEERLQGTAKWIERLDEWYPKQNNYINEWY